VQVATGFQLLKLRCDEPHSFFAFNFNLRRYIEAGLKKLRVVDLKERLAARGLAVSGKKDVLVARLVDAARSRAAAAPEAEEDQAEGDDDGGGGGGGGGGVGGGGSGGVGGGIGGGNENDSEDTSAVGRVQRRIRARAATMKAPSCDAATVATIGAELAAFQQSDEQELVFPVGAAFYPLFSST
jgi:hypothetical protein